MRKITRRSFLQAAGIAAGTAALLTACGGSSSTSTAASTAASTAESSASSAADASDLTENDGYEADLTDIIPADTVTLTVYSQLSNSSGEGIGWFAKILKDKFNVKLNIIPDSEGVYSTRMESGDLGDIVIWGSDGDDYLEAVNKGMLLDWNEDDLVQEYGPYIYAHMQPAMDKNSQISGGTVYGFGHDVGVSATDISSFMYNWSTRWDLYAKLGYPEVKTIDDFADMLIQMQALEPTDEYGKATHAVSLFNDWDGTMAMYPKGMVSAYYGYDEFGIGFYDPKTQKYIPAVDKDGPYVQMLRFYNKLYQAGALDPDSETQGYDGCSEDYRNGNAFFNPFNFLGSGMYNSVDRLAEGKAMFPVVPADASPINYGQNIYGSNRIWSIGENSQYPELCMAIINWLCTPYGKLTDLYGPQDTCWYYDENGNTYFTDLGRACITDGNTQMTGDYSGAYKDGVDPMNNTTWAKDAINPDSNGEDYNWEHWKSNLDADVSEIEQDFRDHVGYDTMDEYLGARQYTLSPGTMYSEGTKSDELTVTWNQVGDCVKTYSWKAMFASSDSEFDSIIDEMVSKAESYGVDQCNAYSEEQAALRKAAEDAALSA